MAEVSVSASASAQFAPELARLTIMIRSGHRSRERAIDELVTKGNALTEWADAVPGVVLREQTVSFHGANNDKNIPYTSELHRVVELHGDDGREALPALLTKVTADLGADVYGPTWDLTPESLVRRRREVTREAVAQAREQAEAYAAALGMEVGSLVRIGDAGSAHAGMSMGVSARSGHLWSVERSTLGELDLTPAPVTVHAGAEATWELVAAAP